MKKIFITILICSLSLALIFTTCNAETYTGLEEETSAGEIYLSGEFLEKDIIKISVHAKEMITPVLGIAFHLAYDADKVSFLRYDPGNFLETGGKPFYLVENNTKDQKIIFGSTLKREDNYPIGSEKISDIYFQIIEGETFSFEFHNGVVSTLDVVRQDISGILWNNIILERNSILFDKNNKNSSLTTQAGSTLLYITVLCLFTVTTIILIIKIYKKKLLINNVLPDKIEEK